MFKADIPVWEYCVDGRWPTRPEHVPYPQGAARIIDKTAPRMAPYAYRRSFAFDGVMLKLEKAKARITGRYYVKVLATGIHWGAISGECDGACTLVKFVQFVEITGELPPPPKKRRKKYVKPYAHPHDGLPHCPQGAPLPCNHWGCR